MKPTKLVEDDMIIWNLASASFFEETAEFTDEELTRIKNATVEFWSTQELIKQRIAYNKSVVL